MCVRRATCDGRDGSVNNVLRLLFFFQMAVSGDWSASALKLVGVGVLCSGTVHSFSLFCAMPRAALRRVFGIIRKCFACPERHSRHVTIILMAFSVLYIAYIVADA